MIKLSDIYVRGNLLMDNEIVIFGSISDRDRAMQLLNNAGIDFTNSRSMVVKIEDSNKLYKYLKKYNGQNLVLGVQRAAVKRTVGQLRFYFGILINHIRQFIYDNTGNMYTKEQIHMDNLLNIWGFTPEIEVINGREIVRMDKLPASGRMDTYEFNLFLEKVKLHYMEMGLIFPELREDSDGTVNEII